MSSNINPANINELFPISGINQSSQGFRSNFSSIKSNFLIAQGEISSLQSTQITVTGDIVNSGTPPILQQSSTLSIPLALNLADILTSSSTIDTSINDYKIDVDKKGRISNITESAKVSYSGDSNPKIKITTNVEDVNNPKDTGIKSLSFPNFTINEYGVITGVDYQDIDGFGLLGYNMPSNSLIVGNSLSLSTYMAAPSNATSQYVLSYSNGELGWEKFNIPSADPITSIISGNYISITGTDNNVVNFDATKLNDSSTFDSTTKVIVKNSDNSLSVIPNNVFQTSLINDGFLKEISQDTSPKLGGTLDLNGNNITSTGNLSITVSGTTKINDIIYPNTLPQHDASYLIYNKDGSTSFTTLSSLITITSSNGIKTTTTTGTNLSLDYTNMTLSTSNLANTNIVVLDTTTNTTKLVKLASFFGEYSKAVFVSPDNGSDSNDGGFNTPVKTIQQAITLNENIILMPGVYSEELSINVSSLNVMALSAGTVKLVGDITLSVQTTSIYFYGINFTIGATDSYLFNFYTTNGDVRFYNCSFDGDNSSITSYFNMSGTISNLIIENCDMNCFLENNFSSGNIIIDGDYISDKKLRYNNNSTSTTYIRNISKLLSVSHSSGNLYLENIDIIYDDTSTTLTNINGTSQNSTDIFVIKNTSTFNPSFSKFTIINLSGIASYYFENVIHDSSKDTINYNAMSYDPLNLYFEPLNEVIVTDANYSLNGIEKYIKISNTVSTNITLPIPSTSYFGTNVWIKRTIKLIGQGNGSISFTNLTSSSGYDTVFDGNSDTSVVLDIVWDTELSSWDIVNRYQISTNNSTTLTNVTESIAATGNTISNAYQLTSKYNVVTTCSAGQGVALPNVSIGEEVVILNRSGNALLIYPDGAASRIETLSYGGSQTMISGGTARFTKTTNSLWRVV